MRYAKIWKAIQGISIELHTKPQTKTSTIAPIVQERAQEMCKNRRLHNAKNIRMKKMASDFTISHLIRIAQWAEWVIRQMKDKPICKNSTKTESGITKRRTRTTRSYGKNIHTSETI